MNVKCFIASLFLGLFLIISSNNAEATHHYLWSDGVNTNYAFWLDDTSIVNSPNKTWVAFHVILEDMNTGELVYSREPVIMYKRNSEWYISFYGDDQIPPKSVEYYSEWWQPWGLKWLLDNGYLEE